ncbi:MAG: NFACT family protein [Chloroflexi bacterium]|nr:NFACT family protein [Chloroflexota bacterium]
MYIDSPTAAALARQVGGLLLGARLQDLLQVDRLTLALELYTGKRHSLLLGADPGRPGLRLVETKARRGAGAPSPLYLALNARGRGMRLLELRQPDHERILTFGFGSRDGVELRLVAELTGRLGNLILLDSDDRIIAAARSVTSEMSRARQILPGQVYLPPPPQHKADPMRVDADALEAWLAEAGQAPAWRVLVQRFVGVSPLAARETVQRAAGDPERTADALDAAAGLASLRSILAPPDDGSEPASVGYAEADADPEAAIPTAYAPYALTHLPRWEPAAGIVEAIERYQSRREGRDAYAGARAAVQSLLDEALARAKRQMAALDREQVDEAGIERLRLSGDLLLAFQHQVPAGADEVTLAWADEPLRIRLDPALSPVENAQRCFDRYRRARRAAEALPQRREVAGAKLATLEQLASDLALAEDRAAIDGVAEDLRESGLLGRPLPRRSAGNRSLKPLAFMASDGVSILVGRNRRQNEVVTFQRAARGDLWLHLLGQPGAHVVIKLAGREASTRTLEEAAGLAAWFSRARGEARASVIVTELRHVSRMRGGGPGMVTYRNERTIDVSPLDPATLRPLGKRA